MPNISISPRFESVARCTIASFVAYTLSVFDIPNAIPPNLKFLIGLACPSLILGFPSYIYILGAACPAILVSIVIGLLGASAVLAGATVSDGLSVAVFAIWALLCSNLSYGSDARGTANFTAVLIAIAGCFALGSAQLVQKGITITVSEPVGEGEGSFVDLASKVLEKVCGENQECWDDVITKLKDPLPITVPEGAGNFAGQTAFLSFSESALQISIPGGLWIVNGFWQWSGVTNSLAVFRNALITFCWVLLVVAIGQLLPPIRTARKMFSCSILPNSIQASVAFVKGRVNQINEEEKEGETAPSNENEICSSDGGLVHIASGLHFGGMAPPTSFEPRLFRNPLELTWTTLKKLDSDILHLVQFAIASEMWESRGWGGEGDEIQLSQDMDILEKCALALSEDREDLVSDRVASSTQSEEEKDVEEGSEIVRPYHVRCFHEITQAIRADTAAWLSAMHHPQYTGLKNTAMSYIPWLVGIITLLKRLVGSLLLPFSPKLWRLRPFLLGFKFVLGVVLLFVLEVYWDDYRGFAFASTPKVGITNRDLVVFDTGDKPNVFSGWTLIGYIMATTPTTEGTVKKGTFRAVGNAVGGFSAWIAIIVCSGSYDQDAEVNLYGLVAWLSVTTAIVAYLFTPDGPEALLGLDPDDGMYGTYFVSTQALCAIEIALGKNKRDIIVANRVVATITGVLMAMLVAIIPPQNRGGDPSRFTSILQSCCETFQSGVRLIAEGADDAKAEIMAIKMSFEANGQAIQKDLQFLLKDASKLHRMCVFKVNPRLKEELDAITVTAAYIISWLSFASHVVDGLSKNLSDEEKTAFMEELDVLLRRSVNIASKVSRESSDISQSKNIKGAEKNEPELIVTMGRLICMRLERHGGIISSVRQ